MQLNKHSNNKNEVDLKRFFQPSNANEFISKKEPSEEEIQSALNFMFKKVRYFQNIIFK